MAPLQRLTAALRLVTTASDSMAAALHQALRVSAPCCQFHIATLLQFCTTSRCAARFGLHLWRSYPLQARPSQQPQWRGQQLRCRRRHRSVTPGAAQQGRCPARMLRCVPLSPRLPDVSQHLDNTRMLIHSSITSTLNLEGGCPGAAISMCVCDSGVLRTNWANNNEGILPCSHINNPRRSSEAVKSCAERDRQTAGHLRRRRLSARPRPLRPSLP